MAYAAARQVRLTSLRSKQANTTTTPAANDTTTKATTALVEIPVKETRCEQESAIVAELSMPSTAEQSMPFQASWPFQEQPSAATTYLDENDDRKQQSHPQQQQQTIPVVLALCPCVAELSRELQHMSDDGLHISRRQLKVQLIEQYFKQHSNRLQGAVTDEEYAGLLLQLLAVQSNANLPSNRALVFTWCFTVFVTLVLVFQLVAGPCIQFVSDNLKRIEVCYGACYNRATADGEGFDTCLAKQIDSLTIVSGCVLLCVFIAARKLIHDHIKSAKKLTTDRLQPILAENFLQLKHIRVGFRFLDHSGLHVCSHHKCNSTSTVFTLFGAKQIQVWLTCEYSPLEKNKDTVETTGIDNIASSSSSSIMSNSSHRTVHLPGQLPEIEGEQED
jgi:hypothetical protein